MDQRQPVGSIKGLFVFLGYALGGLLIVAGAISFGLQLVLIPVGLAIVLGLVTRTEPRLALAIFGSGIGLTMAAILSYRWGVAETIFTPHPGVVGAFVGGLAAIGYASGRLIERRRTG